MINAKQASNKKSYRKAKNVTPTMAEEMKAPSIVLPFFLPTVTPYGSEKCYACDVNEGDAFLDHARQYHKFTVDNLAWAVQNGLDVKCIEAYLKAYHPSNIEVLLGTRLQAGPEESYYPILYFAAERNSPEIVRLLCKAGADPNMRMGPLHSPQTCLPVLAYTILTAEYDLSDTTDTLVALLAAGADPADVPRDMWQDFLLAPLKDNLEDSDGVDRKDLWCTVAIREVLCRNLTLMQRYCLWKADHISKLTVSRKQVADGHSIMPLFEAPYYLIGQSYAVREVLDTITSNLLWESKNPVVLLFTGPSGHGKTELAKRMGDLLSIDSLTVDCATARFETDMFGPQAPYHGCEEGTPLNNYLAKVAGQRAVVFLDEFDKTTSAVRQAMLLLFESGHYNDRRNHQKLDCKNIIWILATNLGTELIRKFAAQHVQAHYQEQQKKVPFDDLRGSVRQIVSDALGAPLTGRLTEIVPFLPFNKDEQAVATYKFMRERRMQVRGAIDIEAKSFLKHIFLNFVDDGEIAKHLAAKSYNPELGARSLSSAVNREIGRKVSDHFQEGTRKTDNEMNNVALPKYDVRVTRDSNAIGRIVVKRVGFKEVQCKPKAVVEE